MSHRSGEAVVISTSFSLLLTVKGIPPIWRRLGFVDNLAERLAVGVPFWLEIGQAVIFCRHHGLWHIEVVVSLPLLMCNVFYKILLSAMPVCVCVCICLGYQVAHPFLGSSAWLLFFFCFFISFPLILLFLSYFLPLFSGFFPHPPWNTWCIRSVLPLFWLSCIH